MTDALQLSVFSSFRSFVRSLPASGLSFFLSRQLPTLHHPHASTVPIGEKSKVFVILFGHPVSSSVPCLDVFGFHKPRATAPLHVSGLAMTLQRGLEPPSETHLGAETTVLCHSTRGLLVMAAGSVHFAVYKPCGEPTITLSDSLSISSSVLIPATRYTEPHRRETD